MSLVKGSYDLVVTGTTVTRWLDTNTGQSYADEGRYSKGVRMFLNKGVWQTLDGMYTFTPDVPFETNDWFVLSCMPSVRQHNVQGPFTESQARESATKRAGQYPRNTYAVFRVLPGNRVTVVPPTPPEPEVVWS